ncbi:Uncharacterised protein [Neisseria zoodegmatis]|uniref:Uncharacterized protein n=1 Tax=Neisseria zoodegmatis TaxID=326523 RepID=A0AB38DTN6_9NEIS|nr:Uncharacterised protein [Neisseria zoodegmatis]
MPRVMCTADISQDFSLCVVVPAFFRRPLGKEYRVKMLICVNSKDVGEERWKGLKKDRLSRIVLPTAARDLCKTPICGAFLRCALPARLPIYMICLHSLRCYALNCIHI